MYQTVTYAIILNPVGSTSWNPSANHHRSPVAWSPYIVWQEAHSLMLQGLIYQSLSMTYFSASSFKKWTQRCLRILDNNDETITTEYAECYMWLLCCIWLPTVASPSLLAVISSKRYSRRHHDRCWVVWCNTRVTIGTLLIETFSENLSF